MRKDTQKRLEDLVIESKLVRAAAFAELRLLSDTQLKMLEPDNIDGFKRHRLVKKVHHYPADIGNQRLLKLITKKRELFGT